MASPRDSVEETAPEEPTQAAPEAEEAAPDEAPSEEEAPASGDAPAARRDGNGALVIN